MPAEYCTIGGYMWGGIREIYVRQTHRRTNSKLQDKPLYQIMQGVKSQMTIDNYALQKVVARFFYNFVLFIFWLNPFHMEK